MSWEQYRALMEREIIKTDDISTDNAYFMATHMPFSQLEVYRGGYNSGTPALLSEDEVFEQLVCNPQNEHRLVIVRGDNGTGKSHLIRYLHYKLLHSPAADFDTNAEHLVFISRLNNSIRGVFAQLLDQGAIQDPDMADKLRKFVSSSDSKDEDAFKKEILGNYITAVRNDTSGKPYKPVICRDIASYLSDSRVFEFLLREGGAISRFYEKITRPSDEEIQQEKEIFSREDFAEKKIIKAVMNQGDPQASDFASTLKGDDDEIARLVDYLNGFTGVVVQKSADISSESTKNVFTQLRKDLKKQGKNLTLLIEDFTGFTGIDSELITVLSTEHGGHYADLCRVTAIIGLTDSYYHANFKDNFLDRVTHMVNVAERTFGSKEFLVQMAARYLNAIYCTPDQVREWSEAGAKIENIPIARFKTPCKWESVAIGGKQATLYPFNGQALFRLYENLPAKSPRMFLKEVLRAQLKEFFDGKEYGDEWYFPLNPANTRMSHERHGSAIDRMESFSIDDRNRIKAVLAIWGDGTAYVRSEENGDVTIGGVNKAFFDDIGLGDFAGTDERLAKENGGSTAVSSPGGGTAQKTKTQMDGATRHYLVYKEDINNWFSRNEPLKYDQDYRGWLRTLIKGDASQGGAINWQDMGVPAYVAEERLTSLNCYVIEEQSTPSGSGNALVYMDRSVESKDALLALNEWDYAKKSWNFDGATYYQQRLITWLERRKAEIVRKVTATEPGGTALPVLEWCLAVQYLKARILGQAIDTTSSYAIMLSLFGEFKEDKTIQRATREWMDLVQYTRNQNAKFDSALTYLRRGCVTTMGAVHYVMDGKKKSCFRADEILRAVDKLVAANWDIEATLPEDLPANHMLFNHASLLKALYGKVKIVMSAEVDMMEKVNSKLTEYVGELNRDNLVGTLSAIQKLFKTFGENGVVGSSDLKTKYDRAPIDAAREILEHVRALKEAATASPVEQLTAYADNSLQQLVVFLRELQEIARKAEQEEVKAQKNMESAGVTIDVERISDDACAAMERLYDQLEGLEVSADAVD